MQTSSSPISRRATWLFTTVMALCVPFLLSFTGPAATAGQAAALPNATVESVTADGPAGHLHHEHQVGVGEDGHLHVHMPAELDDPSEPERYIVGHSVVASNGGSALPSTRRPLTCVADGGYRTVVLYAHLQGTPDERARHLGTIRSTVERSNQLVAASALRSGGPVADLRARCTSSGGTISVATVQVASRDFAALRRSLATAGYNNPREKYLVFADFNSGIKNVAGLADLYHDTRRSLQNHNNGNYPMYAAVYGTTHFAGTTALHELAHTMGAVQRGAPGSDNAGHCRVGGDLLCPANSPRGCSGIVFDCGNDTYFSTNSRSGQWLHHNWNLGWEGNRFIQVRGRATPNLPPTASFTASCTAATCTFDGGASADPDGRVVRYRYEFGDGAQATNRKSTHIFASAGTPTIRLTVWDDRGASATTTRQIRIDARPPVARASISCDELACTLDASSSSDPDGGPITGYRWRLADGRTSTSKIWKVTFDKPGSYPVELTVTDRDRWTGRAESTIRPCAGSVCTSSLPIPQDLDPTGLLDEVVGTVEDLTAGVVEVVTPTLDVTSGLGHTAGSSLGSVLDR